MSANLAYNSRTGKYEPLSVGAAWHKLGHVVSEAQTGKDAVQLSNLNWTVSLKPLRHSNGEQIDNLFGIYRNDRHDNDGFLGYCKGQYVPFQQDQVVGIADSLIAGREGNAHYETAGAIGRGEKIFFSINLRYYFDIVPGDRHETYFNIVNYHNAQGRLTFLINTLRIVCSNTMQMALREKDATVSKITHTRSGVLQLENAKRTVRSSIQSAEHLKERLRDLSQRQLDKKSTEKILDRLFPLPAENASDRAKSRQENKRIEFLELFEKNDDDTFKMIRGTAYNALNAYTEREDHRIGVRQTAAKKEMSSDEIRAERAMTGAGVESKSQALEVILEETKNNPRIDPLKSYSVGAKLDACQNNRDLLDQILDNSERL